MDRTERDYWAGLVGLEPDIGRNGADLSAPVPQRAVSCSFSSSSSSSKCLPVKRLRFENENEDDDEDEARAQVHSSAVGWSRTTVLQQAIG